MIKPKVITPILVSVLITMFGVSCSNHKGQFTVTNQSDFLIDSLSILPNSKPQLISLAKGEKIELFTTMDKVDSDGSYLISFRKAINQNVTSKRFGYYTNGYQIENVINITILNDTLLINSK